jgi:predicted dehydrogenase
MVIHFAVVGAGAIGQVHAEAIGRLDDARLAWIVDADPERAERTAAAHGCRWTTDASEALAASDVDAVVAAVPTHHHRAVVELAASFNKPVLCEKPIAHTADDARAMVETCDRAGVRLMIGHVVRHFPEIARAKRVVDAGDIGAVKTVRASRVSGSPVAARRWLSHPLQGGGVVVDLMIHDLDYLLWFFGDLERVFTLRAGESSEVLPDNEYVQTLLRFRNGVVAHVAASWAHNAFRTQLELAGDLGILSHDSNDALPLRYEAQATGEHASRFELRSGNPVLPYYLQLRHFIDCLKHDSPFLVDGNQAIRSLQAALAVSHSGRTGMPVNFVNGVPVYAEAEA